MPLILKEPVATGTMLGVWRKEEDLEFLQSVYPLIPEENEAFIKIKNPTRKNEWLTTRILLTEMLEKREKIDYSIHGKPFLKLTDLHISISHSRHFVSIITSNQSHPGVDIEHISERVKKVTHKFLSDSELLWCHDLVHITACWSAKEAIFKVFEKELDFKDIEISPFEIKHEKGIFLANVTKKGKPVEFTLNYILIEDNILVYTLPPKNAL